MNEPIHNTTSRDHGPETIPVVELRGITKAFPGVLANDHIDLALRGGEVHCLLGENGAGKSTLMSILSGMVQPDEGDIRVHDTIVLDSMGDYVLSVGGDLTARGLASCDHHIEVRGRARVEFEYKRGMDASAVLNAACLKQGDPGFHDLNEIIARVAAGEPIFAGES